MTNIGIIKECLLVEFSKNIQNKELLKETTKKFDEFNKLLSSSPIVSTIYKICESIENKTFSKEEEAKEYLNENIKLLENISLKEIQNEISKVKSIEINESYSDEELTNLYNSLNTYIIESKKSFYKRNVDLIHESKNTIISYLLKEKKQPQSIDKTYTIPSEDKDEFIKFISEQFEKEMNESSLTEEEKVLLFEAMDNYDKEEGNKKMYDIEKRNLIETMEILKTYITDESAVNELNEAIKSFNSKEYNDDTFLSDIIDFKKAKNQLKS